MGTPSEQVGFQASEEYASRISSPRPQSIYHNKSHSNASQTHIESPLRKENTAEDAQPVSASLGRSLQAPSDLALESEVEDDDTIHVDEPSRRYNKIYGGEKHVESTEDLGLYGEYTEEGEHGYSAPILASDEVAKEPSASWEMQPAVSPHKERRGGYEQDSIPHHRSGSASSLSSRPSSRPTSIHAGISGMRDAHSTPLEDLDEYEPLFPEDEKDKPVTAADRLKRPELKNRKFPSQDIWEDTPTSLQYTATVSTPQVPEEEHQEGSVMKNRKIRENETPAQAFARRQEELAESESSDSGSFLNPEKRTWSKPSAIPAHLAHDARPGMKQRFPSRDIWEDTPDSLQLQTTVSGPQTPEADIRSPPEEHPSSGLAATLRPQIPARPTKPKSSEEGGDNHDKISAPPSIPERPSQKRNIIPPAFTNKPGVPDRPKPVVPARPSKLAREGSQEGLTMVTSAGSAKSQKSEQITSPVASKPKPPVPSRPVGSKIAALQSGFMSDLNKRLQLGPMAPKKDEPKPTEEEAVQEKAPLSDARKGRARGPSRRAPAKTAAPAVITTTTSLPQAVAEKLSSLGFPVPMVQWSINPSDGSLTITTQPPKNPEVEASKPAESPAPAIIDNTASDAVASPQEAASGIEQAKSIASPIEGAHVAQSEELPKDTAADSGTEEPTTASSPVKLSDDPPVVSQSESPVEDGNDGEMTASTVTVKPLTELKEAASQPMEHESESIPSASEETKANEESGVEAAKSPEEASAAEVGETAKDE